jgi:hypothetical protein
MVWYEDPLKEKVPFGGDAATTLGANRLTGILKVGLSISGNRIWQKHRDRSLMRSTVDQIPFVSYEAPFYGG